MSAPKKKISRVKARYEAMTAEGKADWIKWLLEQKKGVYATDTALHHMGHGDFFAGTDREWKTAYNALTEEEWQRVYDLKTEIESAIEEAVAEVLDNAPTTIALRSGGTARLPSANQAKKLNAQIEEMNRPKPIRVIDPHGGATIIDLAAERAKRGV
jgi:hypothetical protein